MSSKHSFYITNYFLNYTVNSRKKMVDIVAYFMSVVNQGLPDVDLQEIFDRTDPEFTLYKAKFTTWKLAKETYQNATTLIEQSFSHLHLDLEAVHGLVIAVYPSNSNEYKSIFRDGLDIYHTDSYYQRIQQLGYLSDRLGLYIPMATEKATITGLCTSITALRDKQQQKAKSLVEASDELELCRVDIADMMYGNVGLLMNKFRKTRDKIVSFFNLDLLYGRGQKEVATKTYGLNVPVNSYGKTAILITSKTTFGFNNTGNVMMQVYTAATPDAPVPTNALTIDADIEVNAKADTLGAVTNTWLIVYNADVNFSGSIDITEIN